MVDDLQGRLKAAALEPVEGRDGLCRVVVPDGHSESVAIDKSNQVHNHAPPRFLNRSAP